MEQEKCPLSPTEVVNNLKNNLAAERQALSFYQDFLDVLEDEGDRQKIAAIIEDEKRHVKIVEYWLGELGRQQ
ncbi:MAG: ferritin family protein [bacterium]